MPTQKNIGENDGLDSTGIVEDVSYIPTEGDADTPEEKSDAQRIADGEITVTDEDSEMFISPDSVFAKPAGDKEEPPDESGGKPGEEKKEKAEAEPDKKEKPDKPAGEKPAEEKKPEEEKKPPAAAPESVQKRINKITREKYEATRRAEAAEEKARKAEEELRGLKNQADKSEHDSKKPKIADFENVEDYYTALGEWGAQKAILEAKVKESEKKPKEPEKKEDPQQDPRQRIYDLGRETYEDFEAVVYDPSLPLTKEVFETVSDSEHAHEILYFLGKNHDKAKDLCLSKSPAKLAREIGRIEAQFIDNTPEVKATTGGEPTELPEDSKKPKPPPAPKAPPPVKPIGSGGKVSKSLEDASIAEYAEKRGFTRDGMKKSRLA